MKLQISQELLQAIIDYLSQRPFREVFQLVAALQEEAGNQPVPEAPSPQEPEEYDVTLDDE